MRCDADMSVQLKVEKVLRFKRERLGLLLGNEKPKGKCRNDEGKFTNTAIRKAFLHLMESKLQFVFVVMELQMK